MAELGELEVRVEPDGTARVRADVVASHGVRPGDHLRLGQTPRRRRRSMLGAATRSIGFTGGQLAELRGEMGEGLGEDLNR